MSYDEKAVVKIDADGGVLKCAKGLSGGDCGYSPNAKVCGKCGAMAVQVKMVPVDEAMSGDTSDLDKRIAQGSGDDFEDELAELDAEIMRRVEKRMKKKKAMNAMGEMEDDEYMDDEDESMDEPAESMKGWNMGKRPVKYKKTPGAPMPEDADDEMMGMEDEVAVPPEDDEIMKGWGMKKRGMRYKKTPGAPMGDDMEEDDSMIDDDEDLMGMEDEDMEEDEMGDEDMDSEEEDMDMDLEEDEEPMMPAAQKMRKGAGKARKGGAPAYAIPDMEALRMARLRKMGTKSADVGMNGYLCAIDRKVYPGSATVCDDCPGGCVAEKGMPGLLHVEGLAEKMFSGDVIDSGYSPQADMFVVDVKTAQGHVNEVFIDGTTAEVLGFHRLDESVFEQKSLVDDIQLIDFNEAASLATKSLPGEVIAVEPDLFEGFDVYKVEIDGVDGKSYDAYVSLDGEVLGWDTYIDESSSTETADIEAEAAEIELKRAFSEEKRQEMAKEGMAMPDGSFPIASEADLRNAIQAHGRAKDIEAAKRHIMKRARDLGLEKLIPTEWSAGAKSVVVEGDEGNDEFLRSLIDFEILSSEEAIDKN